MIVDGIVRSEPLVVYADTRANIEAAFAVAGMHAYATDTGRIGWYDAVYAVWRWGVVNLNDLADVNAPYPNDGDYLVYDAVTSQWITSTAGPGGVSYFISLLDTPSTYVGRAGYACVVDGLESGLVFENLDNRYFRESEYIIISNGVPDAGLPVILDGTGRLDISLIPGAAITTVLNDLLDVNAHPVDGDVLTWSAITSQWIASSACDCITVHAQLSGLLADDHTQYLLVSGARPMSGNLDMDSHEIQNVSVITIANTGLRLLDTGGDNYLTIKLNEDIAANRTLNIVVGAGDRTLTLSGNLTVESASLVNQDLTTDANVNFAQVTLPDSGKLILGTGGDGELYSSSDDIYIKNVTQDKDIIFQINDGAVTVSLVTLDASESIVVLDQGAGGGTILIASSSAVSHPFTSIAASDEYCLFGQASNSGYGGILLTGMTDSGSGNRAFRLNGYVAGSPPNNFTSDAIIAFRAAQTDGSDSITTLADNESMMSLANDTTRKVIWKGNGSVYHTDAGAQIGLRLTAAVATSAALEIGGTTGALLVSRMTTTQRNALTAVNGMIIYNTTTNAFNFYENGSWVSGSGLA